MLSVTYAHTLEPYSLLHTHLCVLQQPDDKAGPTLMTVRCLFLVFIVLSHFQAKVGCSVRRVLSNQPGASACLLSLNMDLITPSLGVASLGSGSPSPGHS